LIGTIADMAFFVTSKDFEQALSSSAKQAGLDPSCVIKTNDDWGKIPEILRDDLSEGDIILIKGEREQRLERLSLSLEGVKVNCKIKSCSLKYIYCKDCSRLV
jgi:UDP-N-acetylmuramyl pentapeptide synthase